MTLWDDIFDIAPRAGRGITLFDGDRPRRVLWNEVVADAAACADGLRRRGVQTGDLVGTVLTNSQAAVAGLLGIWLAGGVAASLPVPARGMPLPQYVAQLLDLSREFDAPFLLSDDAVAQALRANAADGKNGRALAGWSDVRGSGRLTGTPPTDEQLAFVQYSSGSTSAPKGCMLSARSIAAQVELVIAMLGADEHDIVSSWLPLSHDMGLFGLMLPTCARGAELVLSSPERFLARPRSWLSDCAEHGATISAGPSSALRLAARGARHGGGGQPLRLRQVVVGAEPIHPAELEALVDAFGPSGLTPEVFMCAYGMAEATLAVTAIGRDEAPSAIALDCVALADGNVRDAEPDSPGVTTVMSVGRALPGTTIELEPGGSQRLSEIHVRSTCLASGYLGDPEQSAARFADGRFATGDLGFERDGQLYVVGRVDDMISINGRNVYASEIETAIASLAEIRRGCCTIVDVPRAGGTALVALAEVAEETADLARLAGEMSRLAAHAAGVRLDECLFLAKGQLPKTPSGKIQRYRSRALAAGGETELLASVSLTSGR